jgi:hypothetical protein
MGDAAPERTDGAERRRCPRIPRKVRLLVAGGHVEAPFTNLLSLDEHRLCPVVLSTGSTAGDHAELERSRACEG